MISDHTTSIFETESFRLAINANGQMTTLEHRPTGASLLAPDAPAPLLRLTVSGKDLLPETLIRDDGLVVLSYDGDRIRAKIGVTVRPTHLVFELKAIEGQTPDLVHWGPYPTTVGEMVGETVGVARDRQVAAGIQALTMQTVGGFAEEAPEHGFGDPLNAAASTPFGSVLQAYSRERDGGVIGSSIALFVCSAEEALSVIGRIEEEQGLPHPMLDGVWGKTSETARRSYLITGFGEHAIDRAIDYTLRAGLTYLYHEDPFRTWGHFALKPDDFPDGDRSLQRCVERARQAGVRMGVHILSNFITTNDAYVTPIPDGRLMRVGTGRLGALLRAADTEIVVDDPTPFRDRGTLATAVVEHELIQYRTVSDTPPWRLIGCRRGAFGTAVSDHPEGAEVGKLADHPYRVFFPNLAMQDELADRLIALFNTTGLRQISFDGLEGCGYTGHGAYAHHRFVQRCFDGWQGEIVNDASRLLHYLWHIHTRMNWGEPWGKAMREGMPEYRFRNQPYFERNLFPRMLGWFQLRLASSDLNATTLDDIEWVLARCAGFDAGFALSASLDALAGNGQTSAMLEATRQWEKARLSNAFTDEQRRRLRDPSGDFHLEAVDENRWTLYPVSFSPTFTHDGGERQPGAPAGTECLIDNPYAEQPARMVMRAVNGLIVHPSIEIGFEEIAFPVTLQPGEYLVWEAESGYRICDANWNTLREERLSHPVRLLRGNNEACIRGNETSKGLLETRFMMTGPGEMVGGS